MALSLLRTMQRDSKELIIIAIDSTTTNPTYRKLAMPEVPTSKLAIIVDELSKAAELRQSHLVLLRSVSEIADTLEKAGDSHHATLIRLAVSNAHDRHDKIESDDSKGTE